MHEEGKLKHYVCLKTGLQLILKNKIMMMLNNNYFTTLCSNVDSFLVWVTLNVVYISGKHNS